MFLFLDHSWLSHSAQQSTPVLIALSSDFTSVSESAQSKILSFFIEYFICDFNSKNIFPRHSKCLPKLPSRIPRSLCKLLNYLNMHIYPLKVQNWPLDMTWKAPTTTLFQDIEIRSTYNTQWKNGFLFILLHNLESIWNSVETFTLMSESFCYQSRYMVVCTRSHCGTQLPHPLPLTNKLVTFNQGEKLLPQILGGFD